MIGKTAQLEFKMVDAAGTAGFSLRLTRQCFLHLRL